MLKTLRDLKEFSSRIGILNNQLKSSSASPLGLGSYGQLLLNQIKLEWLRANLYKFENNLLIEDHDVAKHLNQSLESFKQSSFCNNQIQSSQIGLINVFNSKSQKNPANLSKFNLIGTSSSSTYYLNAYRFFLTSRQSGSSSLLSESIGTPNSYYAWQRERKNWWSKLFNYPECVQLVHTNGDTTLVYDMDMREINETAQVTTKSSNDEQQKLIWLEDLKNIDLSTNEAPFKVFADQKSVVITQTSAQSILNAILIDSVQTRMKSKKTVFMLDFRLAPYKACILYDRNSSNDDHTSKIEQKTENSTNGTNDLKSTESNRINDKKLTQTLKTTNNLDSVAAELHRLLYMNQMNSFVNQIQSSSDLNDKHDNLDEIGIPFSIYLPSTVAKDGICFVRNRDTMLNEKIHISQIPKQFNLFKSSLSY